MKKKVLKIITLSITIFVFYIFVNNVNANSISKISMDIYVNSNGDANITEVWDCNVNQGTEVYHPYYNLGKSEIKNFRVKDEIKEYTDIGRWNTSGTLASKAYKSGINKISNGVELCLGMSSYGNHVYTLNYTITNFVSELKDSQMIYWTLIPYDFSNTIGKAYVKIHTDFDIENTIDVWGYGDYGGTAYVYDGYIEMASNESLEKDEYMTILVKFPLGTFNTSSKISKDFDYYYNMAEEGSKKYNENNGLNLTIDDILYLALMAIPLGIGGIVIVYFIINKGFNAVVNHRNKKRKKLKNVIEYSGLPCSNDIFKIYYIAYEYDLLKNITDFLGAIILKWVKEKIVKIESDKENGVFLNNKNHFLILDKSKEELIIDKREKNLFGMMYEASKDGVLENDEFELWCKRKYNKIFSWFSNVLKEEQKKYIANKEIKEKEISFLSFRAKEYFYNQGIEQQARQIAGLKLYLERYTLIKDRETIEVHLFEDYLIIAQILGIAEKVQKQLSKLYPETLEQTDFTYNNLYFIQRSVYRGISTARTSKSSAESRARSYSSGGGGFSSGGGGGGSFGRPVEEAEDSVKIKNW